MVRPTHEAWKMAATPHNSCPPQGSEPQHTAATATPTLLQSSPKAPRCLAHLRRLPTYPARTSDDARRWGHHKPHAMAMQPHSRYCAGAATPRPAAPLTTKKDLRDLPPPAPARGRGPAKTRDTEGTPPCQDRLCWQRSHYRMSASLSQCSEPPEIPPTSPCAIGTPCTD